MKIPEITRKEQLILNELVLKYNLNEAIAISEVVRLHQQLIGTLNGKWYQRYLTPQSNKKNVVFHIYALLVYPLAYPSLPVGEEMQQGIKSFYWQHRIGQYVGKMNHYSQAIGRVVDRNNQGKWVMLKTGVSDGL